MTDAADRQSGGTNDGGNGRIHIDRHSGGIIVTFVDGHANWAKQENRIRPNYVLPTEGEEFPNPNPGGSRCHEFVL